MTPHETQLNLAIQLCKDNWYTVLKRNKEWTLRYIRDSYEWPKPKWNTFQSRRKRSWWCYCKTQEERNKIIDICINKPLQRYRGGDKTQSHRKEINNYVGSTDKPMFTQEELQKESKEFLSRGYKPLHKEKIDLIII